MNSALKNSAKGAVLLLSTALVCSFALLASASADDAPARFLESTLDSGDGSVHVGDEVRYKVSIGHSPDVEVHIGTPPEGSRWQELDRRIDVERRESDTVTHAHLRYALYRPGPTQGPPVSVRLLSSESAEPEVLELPRHPLNVVAITDDEAGLEQARAPRPLWTERPWLVWGALGTGALICFSLVALLLLRRRDPVLDDVAPLAPEDAAFQALDALRNSTLLQEERFKDYYLRLSEILRRYLGRRFGFPGTEWTTTEIVAFLNELQHPEFGADKEALATWLRACDRVKFAGYRPSIDQAEAHLKEAYDFVNATLPRPPAPTEQATPQQQEAS